MAAAGPLSAGQLAAFEQDGVVTLDTPFTAVELDPLEVWMRGCKACHAVHHLLTRAGV